MKDLFPWLPLCPLFQCSKTPDPAQQLSQWSNLRVLLAAILSVVMVRASQWEDNSLGRSVCLCRFKASRWSSLGGTARTICQVKSAIVRDEVPATHPGLCLLNCSCLDLVFRPSTTVGQGRSDASLLSLPPHPPHFHSAPLQSVVFLRDTWFGWL